MTTATRFPKSWAIAGFDIKDPSLVLYLPLWYPYSDMAGSTIYSYDRNRATGTVTGAVWGRLGRTYDGVDDILTVTDYTAITNLATISILGWVNPTTSGEGNTGGMVWKPDGGAIQFGFYGARGLDFIRQRAGVDGEGYSATNYITLGVWQMWTGTYSASATNVYVNDAEITYSGQTVGDGALTSDVGDLFIGNRNTGDKTFDGIIGEVQVYNRVLTLAEIRYIYQATKWRY